MWVLLIPTLPNPAELLRRTTSIIINIITALGLTVCSNTFYVQVEQWYTAYTIPTQNTWSDLKFQSVHIRKQFVVMKH